VYAHLAPVQSETLIAYLDERATRTVLRDKVHPVDIHPTTLVFFGSSSIIFDDLIE
jgi:hypothetical protein